jgi:hypothetical protein
MSRYEVREHHGDIQIYDTEEERIIVMPEAAEILNDLMSLEDKKSLQNLVSNCETKLNYDLLDKTLEILMLPIMDQKTKDLVNVVEGLSKGGKAEWACANLLRRAIYLKALAEADIE